MSGSTAPEPQPLLLRLTNASEVVMRPAQGVPWKVGLDDLMAAMPAGSANQQALRVHVSSGFASVRRDANVAHGAMGFAQYAELTYLHGEMGLAPCEERTYARKLNRKLPPAGYQRRMRRRWRPDDPRRLTSRSTADSTSVTVSACSAGQAEDSQPRPPVFPEGDFVVFTSDQKEDFMRLEWTNGTEGRALQRKTQTVPHVWEVCYTFAVGGPEHPSFIGDVCRGRIPFPWKGTMVFEGSPAIVTEIR